MKKLLYILLYLTATTTQSPAQDLFIAKKAVTTFNCDTIFYTKTNYSYSPFVEFKYHTKSQTIDTITYYCFEFNESSYGKCLSWFFYQNNQINTLITLDTVLDNSKKYEFSKFLNLNEDVGNKWLFKGANFFYIYQFELKNKVIDTTNHDIIYSIDLTRTIKVSDQDVFTSLIISKNNGIIKLGISAGHLYGELINCDVRR